VPVRSRAGGGASAGAAMHSDRALDQGAEHLMVDVVEAPEVDAALSRFMRTKPLQQIWISVLNATDEIQHEICLTR